MTVYRGRSRPRWLVDVGPLAVIAACLWGKLVHISLVLPSASGAGEEWLHWLGIVRAYPHVFSGTLASLALILAPLPLVARVPRFALLLVLDLLITCVAVADLVHVRFYADVSSVSELSATPMLAWVVESIVTLLEPTDAVYFVDVVAGTLALPFYARACRRLPAPDRRPAGRLTAGLAASGLILILPTAQLAASDTRGIFAYTTLRLEAAAAVGVLPYHLFETIGTLSSAGRTIGEPERERVRQLLEENRRQQGPPSDLFGVAAGKNLIVISAESLHTFPIGMEVAGQPIAPRLTELARESLYFTNFHDQTHLGSTSDAEFAVMQSLHPLPVGVVAARYARNQYRGLPAILAERGYQTFSAVAALDHFWNMNQLHPRYGFQKSYFEGSFQMTEKISVWLADHEFFTQALPIFGAQTEPFMGFLLSSSNHHPYVIPEKYRSLRLGELEGTMVGDYLHSVHYFDRVFGEFLDQLRQTGLLDRSVLVVYGDHQAFLGEFPELPRLLGLPRLSEYDRFRVVKKTPLFIRLPHGAAAGQQTTAAGHVDVAPTVLALLGVADESAVMLGRDLTRASQPLVVFRDGSFADGSHYFVHRFGPTFSSRCYEADSGRPLDCAPLASRLDEARRRLQASDLIIQNDLIPSVSAPR